MKKIKIINRGPIRGKGGIQGPINTPYWEQENIIFRLICTGSTVVEVMTDGSEVNMTSTNFNTNNEVPPVDAGKKEAERVAAELAAKQAAEAEAKRLADLAKKQAEEEEARQLAELERLEAEEKAAADKAAADKLAEEKLAADKAATDKSAADKANNQQQTFNQQKK